MRFFVLPLTNSNPMTPRENDDIEALERRNNSRRLSDRHWQMILMAALGLVASGAMGYGASRQQTASALDQKVDKIEYIRDRANEEAAIAANRARIEGSDQKWDRLQASVDSANVRLREIVCYRQAASCR